MSQICLDLGASTSPSKPQFARFDLNRVEVGQRVLFRVELKKGEDGWIIAKCLDVSGAISQGKSKDEALRNIVEAISAIQEDISGGEAPEFSIAWVEK
jgi:predicted RNase H-like HicB family nuclease